MRPSALSKDLRIVGRNPNQDLLDRWFSMAPDRRKRVFVSTRHAAEIAGYSRRTILDWIYCGKVISLRIGNNYQILIKSLKAYLCSNSEQ
jgi:hypothetical protein